MLDVAASVVVGHPRHAAFTVTGRDAGTYLHSQTSNDILSLRTGESCQCFLLEPTGRVDALMRVTKIADEPLRYLLDVDDIDPAPLVARLERFKIRVHADIAPQAADVLAVRLIDRSENEESSPLAEFARLAVSAAAQRIVTWATSHGAKAWAVPAWWGDGRALDVIITELPVPVSSVRDVLDSEDPGDPRPVTDEVLEALRIRCGWPAMGAEIRPGETIPAATGVVKTAVSFTKGCYPGQELVERMDSRGSSAPQSLRIVPRSVLGELQPGGTIVVDGNEVGTVTSVGDDLVLAYVARSVSLGVVVGES